MSENIQLKNTNDVVNAVRYIVKTRAAWERFVADNNITRDNIAETARALATLAYPNDEPVQKADGKRTRYGNAVQAAAFNLRKVIGKDENKNTTPDWLALAVQAAKNATAHEISADDVLTAVTAALVTGTK